MLLDFPFPDKIDVEVICDRARRCKRQSGNDGQDGCHRHRRNKAKHKLATDRIFAATKVLRQ